MILFYRVTPCLKIAMSWNPASSALTCRPEAVSRTKSKRRRPSSLTVPSSTRTPQSKSIQFRFFAASNSALAAKKRNWIDFDCGVLVEDGTVEELGRKLFDFVLETASGKQVKAEEAGFHDMAIFKQGVTL